MDKKVSDKKETEFEVVYTTYITLRNGKKLYASSIGKKVFKFLVPKK